MRYAHQGNRMNTVIMMRERLSFRPSPDKGRTGGVCGSEITFLYDLPPKPPSFPPCQGEADKQPLSSTSYGGFMRWPCYAHSLLAMTSAMRYALSFANVP
jgi:hypothetical protein